jgi:hypothetical protein
MNKIAIALLLASSLVHADKADELRNLCKLHSEVSGMIMEGRQAGMPITTYMAIADDATMQPIQRKMSVDMVVAAYQKPKFINGENQKQAAVEFANTQYLECSSRLGLLQAGGK